jgi:hypothetical protein
MRANGTLPQSGFQDNAKALAKRRPEIPESGSTLNQRLLFEK